MAFDIENGMPTTTKIVIYGQKYGELITIAERTSYIYNFSMGGNIYIYIH